MNPECRAGKHANCDAKGWRDDLGHIGPCLCGCHDTTPAAPAPMQTGGPAAAGFMPPAKPHPHGQNCRCIKTPHPDAEPANYAERQGLVGP